MSDVIDILDTGESLDEFLAENAYSHEQIVSLQEYEAAHKQRSGVTAALHAAELVSRPKEEEEEEEEEEELSPERVVMSKDDRTADVHPLEVDNWIAGGWEEV